MGARHRGAARTGASGRSSAGRASTSAKHGASEGCCQCVELMYLHDRRLLDGEAFCRRDGGNGPIRVLISAGASCPDALVDRVVSHLAGLLGREDKLLEALEPYRALLTESN